MGIQDLLIPDNTQILTANEDGQPLQVIGRLCHLYMAVSHTLVFHLYSITVVRNLSHPLNLGGVFSSGIWDQVVLRYVRPRALGARGVHTSPGRSDHPC